MKAKYSLLTNPRDWLSGPHCGRHWTPDDTSWRTLDAMFLCEGGATPMLTVEMSRRWLARGLDSCMSKSALDDLGTFVRPPQPRSYISCRPAGRRADKSPGLARRERPPRVFNVGSCPSDALRKPQVTVKPGRGRRRGGPEVTGWVKEDRPNGDYGYAAFRKVRVRMWVDPVAGGGSCFLSIKPTYQGTAVLRALDRLQDTSVDLPVNACRPSEYKK